MEETTDHQPTMLFYFLERDIGTKRLNILHQVWTRPDGSQYLREVGKLSHQQAKEKFPAPAQRAA